MATDETAERTSLSVTSAVFVNLRTSARARLPAVATVTSPDNRFRRWHAVKGRRIKATLHHDRDSMERDPRDLDELTTAVRGAAGTLRSLTPQGQAGRRGATNTADGPRPSIRSDRRTVMTTSLSNHSPSARPVGGFEEDPLDEDNPYEARLRGLSRQQLADRLTWLAWYQPGIFTAVMDYMEFSDVLAADTDPASPDLDNLDYGEEPVPVCSRCGADIGIFIKFGLDWRHYREGAALGQAEIFDPGHAPELTWRLPDPALPGI
jgi:hypothetical protein